MKQTENDNHGRCSCPSLDGLTIGDECCEGLSGIGSTLYIGEMPEGGMQGLNPVNMQKIELSDAPMWNDKADGGQRGYSITGTITFDEEQSEAVKRLLSLAYFQKRDIKKMRYFVTHGFELMFEYTDADGHIYPVFINTPRKLRQLMERTHRARTNWCKVKFVNAPKTPGLGVGAFSRAELLRIYRKYGGCEGCPHRRDDAPDYPDGCDCPDELPCLNDKASSEESV